MLSSCGVRVSVGDGFNLLANYLCEIIFKTSIKYNFTCKFMLKFERSVNILQLYDKSHISRRSYLEIYSTARYNRFYFQNQVEVSYLPVKFTRFLFTTCTAVLITIGSNGAKDDKEEDEKQRRLLGWIDRTQREHFGGRKTIRWTNFAGVAFSPRSRSISSTQSSQPARNNTTYRATHIPRYWVRQIRGEENERMAKEKER